MLSAALLDVRFALRSLRRRPTFAVVAVATIALAMGAATSIYSVVDAILFRSLPYANAGQLVAVWQTNPSARGRPITGRNWDRVPLDYTDFMTWRRRQTVFSGVGVWAERSVLLTTGDAPEQVAGQRVSPSLFEVLGVRPILGRGVLPGEDVPGGPHVTVISYEAWQSRFGGRMDVLGQTIAFDHAPYTIVGVLPRGFTLERGKPGASFWVPAGQSNGDIGQGNRSFRVVARLAPGVTLERAITETTQLLQGPDPAKSGVRVVPYQLEETRDVRRPLLILLGAVGLLLLIACVNIATLLLGEGAAREPEMAARMALGAGRGRLVAQLLTESVTLAVAGGLGGSALAWWGTKGLVAMAPERIPGILTVHMDLRVLTVSLAAAATTGMLFGLAPAVALSRSNPALVLRAAVQGARGRGRLQRVMIATELALSVVLLVGAALLSRSLNKLTAVDPGLRTDNVLAVRLAVPNSAFATDDAARAFRSEVLSRLAVLPGVTGTTATSAVPFSGSYSSSGYFLPGQSLTDMAHRHSAQQRIVAPGYFETLGIPVLAGRSFTRDDGPLAPRVALVSETAARRDWPNESAVGQRITYQQLEWTVVGVVADSKYLRLNMPDEATIYVSMEQRPADVDLLVRTRGNAGQLVPAVRRVVHEVSPAVVVTGTDLLDDLLRRSFAEERFRTKLIALFGVMAGLLAAVGMYGVTARAVGRRTREVGIRIALGATAPSVVRMIVLDTLSGVAVGVAAGAIVALLASRLLAPLLFGVSVHDPVTYAGTFALLAVVSVAASWLPARHAGRLQPSAVLRGE